MSPNHSLPNDFDDSLLKILQRVQTDCRSLRSLVRTRCRRLRQDPTEHSTASQHPPTFGLKTPADILCQFIQRPDKMMGADYSFAAAVALLQRDQEHRSQAHAQEEDSNESGDSMTDTFTETESDSTGLLADGERGPPPANQDDDDDLDCAPFRITAGLLADWQQSEISHRRMLLNECTE